jgi:Prokaryotic E2 family E
MLPESDELDADIRRLEETTGFHVDILRDGSQIGVVINDVPLPGGIYDQSECQVLLRTDVQYPLSAMDMFWISPPLQLANGGDPAGSSSEVAFGLTWQRFSWHRNVEWLPGRDDLVSHFDFALARLQRPE